MNSPTIPFDQYKVCIQLLPLNTSGLQMMKFAFQVNVHRGYSYNELKDKNGNLYFSPWVMLKDKFGGDTMVNETYQFQGYVQPIVYPISQYQKFIRQRNCQYPTWVGYFKDHYMENREWNKSGKKEVLETAKFERILAKELEEQINSFKFTKV